jgi:hypothetical protein
MALTKIGTDGVKDDAITSGKIPANAVGSSEIADTSVTLAKLEHGTSSNDGKFLRANNGADPTFETVNTDLVSDTSPQLGGHLDCQTFNIDIGDSPGSASGRIKFGNGDLQIYHDGNHSYIDNTGTGNLYLKDAGVVKVRTGTFGVDNADGSEAMISATADGSVELYHNNVKTFETKSSGARVSSRLGVNCNPSDYHPLQVEHNQQYLIGIKNLAAHNSYFPWLMHKAIASNKQAFGIHFNGISGDKFHVDQNGAVYLGGETAAANALDDYEEGTFSPTFNGSSGGTNIGYGVNVGNYTKIGNMVSIEIYLNVDTVHANGSGHLRIGGLPFTKTSRYGGLNISYMYGWNGVDISHALVDVSSTQIYLYKLNTSSGSNYYSDTLTVAGAVTNSTEIMLNGIYFTS